MFEPTSRQDRYRTLIESFLDTASIGCNLNLLLYPSEEKRFKKEFPELNFVTIDSFKVGTSKKYKVSITRKVTM